MTQRLYRWVELGMLWSMPPTIVNPDDEDSIDALWLKTDGTLLRMGPDLKTYIVTPPYAVGYETACVFWTGAVLCGANPIAAIEMAVKHCTHVGGDIQIEKIK